MKRSKHGQSTAEYAIVIALVLGAVIGMQTYVRRALQGRVRDATEAHMPGDTINLSQYGTSADPGGDPGLFGPTFSKFNRRSFEPYYATSTTDTTTQIDTMAPGSTTPGGNVHVEGAVGTASAVTGGYQTLTQRGGTSGESAPQN
jgi:hypothetical protein